MTDRQARALAWSAWLDGVLNGCDPYVGGKVPAEMMRYWRRCFASWWKRNGRGVG